MKQCPIENLREFKRILGKREKQNEWNQLENFELEKEIGNIEELLEKEMNK